MNEKLIIVGLIFLSDDERLAESILSWVEKQEKIKKGLKLDVLIRSLLKKIEYENFDLSRSD